LFNEALKKLSKTETFREVINIAYKEPGEKAKIKLSNKK
jgi:hypothetical protein